MDSWKIVWIFILWNQYKISLSIDKLIMSHWNKNVRIVKINTNFNKYLEWNDGELTKQTKLW